MDPENLQRKGPISDFSAQPFFILKKQPKYLLERLKRWLQKRKNEDPWRLNGVHSLLSGLFKPLNLSTILLSLASSPLTQWVLPHSHFSIMCLAVHKPLFMWLHLSYKQTVQECHLNVKLPMQLQSGSLLARRFEVPLRTLEGDQTKGCCREVVTVVILQPSHESPCSQFAH